MSITQTFHLNLIPEQGPTVIHCDQYDEGTGRLIIKLYDGDVAYAPTGTAKIQGRKPDGHGFEYDATLSGNTVTANLTKQMTAVAGPVRCQVVVKESSDRTGTFVFILEVQHSALPDDTEMSDSDYQFIEQALEQTQEMVEDAEAWAVGERGGVPVDPTDPTYDNNSKYWAYQASQYAQGGLIFKGSVAFASIPTTGLSNGDMYNITDDFTTDSRFIEGAGVFCAAGTNIAWEDSVSKWDVLASQKSQTLDDLSDVTITTPTNDQVLKYDSNAGKWVNGNGGGGGASTLDDLTDVDITTPVDQQVLTYDSNSGEWINANAQGGVTQLDQLSDVTISAPTDGQSLVYDSNAGEWVNGNGGGGSSTLSGLTDVTITSATDNQVLTYDANAGEWINANAQGGPTSLDNLSNVDITTPTDGQALLYDANSGDWVNGTVSGGGGMNTNGSNAATNVGFSGTKVFTVGDRTGKSATGTEAIELGSGANATGFGAIAEGAKCFNASTNSVNVPANTLSETLVQTISLTTYPYQCFSLQGSVYYLTNIEVYVENGLDQDETITNGNVTVRLTQDGTDIKAYGTNTGGSAEPLYFGYTKSQNVASGMFSHVEGVGNLASGAFSHAEGRETQATSDCAHAEGYYTVASGRFSHAEGQDATASSWYTHAEGNFTRASAYGAHAEGYGTKASSQYQHVSGKYNVEDTSNTYALIVGNGTGDGSRSNALTLDWSGNLETDGDVANGNGVSLDGLNTVSTLAVSLTGWTTDTTSQSGTTLYKKQITLSHVYADNPSVDVGAGTGYVLPTVAEQEAYNLLLYVTVDDSVPCLYLYASAIPTTAFYIKVTGVD